MDSFSELRMCLAPGKLTLLCVYLASSQQPDFCRCVCVCVFCVSFSCVLATQIHKEALSALFVITFTYLFSQSVQS